MKDKEVKADLWTLPADRSKNKRPLSGFSRAKRRIDSEMLRLARAEAKSRGDDPEKIEIPNWTVHDLRHSFADEKKAAFEAWSRHVESLVNPKKANVVQIGKRKRQNV